MCERKNVLWLTIFISLLFTGISIGQVNTTEANLHENILGTDRSNPNELMDFQTSYPTTTNISDSNTTLIGHWVNGPCLAVDVSGNIAYFGNGASIEAVDFSDPSNPVHLGRFFTSSLISDIKIVDGYAYIVNYNQGLSIIDISIPSSMIEVGYISTGDWASDIAVNGSYAYVTQTYGTGGIFIIDISVPTSPQIVSFFDNVGDERCFCQ